MDGGGDVKIFPTRAPETSMGNVLVLTTISDRGNTCVAEDMLYHVDAMSTDRPGEMRSDEVAERSWPMR